MQGTAMAPPTAGQGGHGQRRRALQRPPAQRAGKEWPQLGYGDGDGVAERQAPRSPAGRGEDSVGADRICRPSRTSATFFGALKQRRLFSCPPLK